MHCLSCDCLLSDYEATRKYSNGEYVDLCNRCFRKAEMGDIVVSERSDLKEYGDVYLEEEIFYEESLEE